MSQRGCCLGEGRGRAGRRETFHTILGLPQTWAQARLRHNTDVTTLMSQGQARHSQITLYCSLQSQEPSDPVQCPSIKAPPPILSSQHRSARGSKCPAGLQNCQSSAECPSPLCSLRAGEEQGGSAVPSSCSPSPNPIWIHRESLWRQAVWWRMHRSLAHLRISLLSCVLSPSHPKSNFIPKQKIPSSSNISAELGYFSRSSNNLGGDPSGFPFGKYCLFS